MNARHLFLGGAHAHDLLHHGSLGLSNILEGAGTRPQSVSQRLLRFCWLVIPMEPSVPNSEAPRPYLLLRGGRGRLGRRRVVAAVVVLRDPELEVLGVPLPLHLAAGATLLRYGERERESTTGVSVSVAPRRGAQERPSWAAGQQGFSGTRQRFGRPGTQRAFLCSLSVNTHGIMAETKVEHNSNTF